VLDGNLLQPGDTGKLTVSQKSDRSVVYDARLTALTVAADGSFNGAGEDAGKAGFTITGTCDVSWLAWVRPGAGGSRTWPADAYRKRGSGGRPA
jgi:hypothetical protein